MLNLTTCKEDFSDWDEYPKDPNFNNIAVCVNDHEDNKPALQVKNGTSETNSNKMNNITGNYTIAYYYRMYARFFTSVTQIVFIMRIKIFNWRFEIEFEIDPTDGFEYKKNIWYIGHINKEVATYWLDLDDTHLNISNSEIENEQFLPIIITFDSVNNISKIYMDGLVFVWENYYFPLNTSNILISSDGECMINVRKMSIWNRLLTSDEILEFSQKNNDYEQEQFNSPFMCYGKLCNNVKEACSGHGCCSSLDVCVCENNWSGLDCSIPNYISCGWRTWGIVAIPLIALYPLVTVILIIWFFLLYNGNLVKSQVKMSLKYNTLKE
jgi:hypothetical protein